VISQRFPNKRTFNTRSSLEIVMMQFRPVCFPLPPTTRLPLVNGKSGQPVDSGLSETQDRTSIILTQINCNQCLVAFPTCRQVGCNLHQWLCTAVLLKPEAAVSNLRSCSHLPWIGHRDSQRVVARQLAILDGSCVCFAASVFAFSTWIANDVIIHLLPSLFGLHSRREADQSRGCGQRELALEARTRPRLDEKRISAQPPPVVPSWLSPKGLGKRHS